MVLIRHDEPSESLNRPVREVLLIPADTRGQ